MARKARQARLPGLEEANVPEIEALADEVAELTANRMRLLRDEITKRDQLMEAMKAHKLKVYNYDGKQVVLVQGATKVKVKATEAEDCGSEEGEGGEE